MLVPGPWRRIGELTKALAARGVVVQTEDDGPLKSGQARITLVEDEQLGKAFSWGRGGPLDAALVSRIASCERAALVEFAGSLREQTAELARLGRALRDVGGLAVRMEASGCASAWGTWLACVESGVASRLYQCAVLLVQGDDGELFTCGMHAFDLPDAKVTLDDPSEAMAWLDALCTFQLEEDPTLASGHTFRPDADSERRTLERWPDDCHDSSDGRYNPFGLWHLLPADAARVEAQKLTLTFMPALVVVLSAAEQSKGAPLTESEVEQIVSKGAVIAMEPRDAVQLERSRGYADIEPELAWEQWQIFRGTAQ